MNEEDFSKAEIDAIEAACKRIENMMKVGADPELGCLTTYFLMIDNQCEHENRFILLVLLVTTLSVT